MGRSKTSKPKRQRIDITDTGAGEPSTTQAKDADVDADAIEKLQNVPSGIVEEAAADIYRSLIHHYDNLDDMFRVNRHHNPSTETTSLTATTNVNRTPAHHRPRPQFDGVGRCTPQTTDFAIFQRLFDTIKNLAGHSKMTSWSGDPSDPRRRAFGFLPHTLGYQDSIRKLLDISMPSTAPNTGSVGGVDDVENERSRNERAMVILDPSGHSEFLNEVKDAVERLLAQLRAFVNPSSGLRKYLHYSQ
mmetsp:Transcript_17534/g.21516  ORF Transcript_17534/g.21516 Transcript_17534/m.21516 type:complete len:246 (+) Transcript_17534:35-772(+)